MTKTDPNAPAYPSHAENGEKHCGLTKREWMTGMALEGLLSDHDQMRKFEDSAIKAAKSVVADRLKEGITIDLEETTRESLDVLIAFRSVEIADMVILQLNKTEAETPVVIDGPDAPDLGGCPGPGNEHPEDRV